MPSPAEAVPSLVFAPELTELGSAFELSGAESHYVLRVCRARPGDLLGATDGCGVRATLRLISAERPARVRVESRQQTRRRARAWICCGAPEGQRADWLVEKLAELGIEAWQPIDSERGRWKQGTRNRARWQRLAIAAMRQSRRCFLMDVREPIELASAIAGLPPDAKRWLASETGAEHGHPSGPERLDVALIGPSSGFSQPELKLVLDAGFNPISLSDGRLRTETAALAWASWWSNP